MLPEALKKPQSWVRKVCAAVDGGQVCGGYLQVNGGLVKKPYFLVLIVGGEETCESRIQLEE